VLQPLGSQHDRKGFSCGVAVLDRYFRERARQDERRHLARCSVLVELASGRVAGFFTLSAYGVVPASLPEEERRGLPSYDLLPAVLLGRLALDHAFQGEVLDRATDGSPVTVGSLLLFEALTSCRALAARLGLLVVVVDAKDDRAARFYRRHGFLPIPERPQRLFLPIAAIDRLLTNLPG
jgi:GNAT superfamily N-acetyltransferase